MFIATLSTIGSFESSAGFDGSDFMFIFLIRLFLAQHQPTKQSGSRRTRQ